MFKEDKINLSGFESKPMLNQRIWDDSNTMKPEIRKRLLRISNEYFNGLGLNGVDILDITLTGSLANFHWSEYSDVDLHIIVDYKEVPMKYSLVADFLKTKSTLWNETHNIKIYGFDVELYVQDEKEPHTSTGVYSVLKNKWLIKPKKVKTQINDEVIIEKSEKIIDIVDKLEQLLRSGENMGKLIKLSDKLKDKIKKMRKSGLDRVGEWSVENLVFKVLRRNGTLDKLHNIKNKSYDKYMTLENN
jgi:hypothetical protein